MQNILKVYAGSCMSTIVTVSLTYHKMYFEINAYVYYMTCVKPHYANLL